MIAILHGTEIRFDRWAHNVQRGFIELNQFAHPLFFSAADPSDDYLAPAEQIPYLDYSINPVPSGHYHTDGTPSEWGGFDDEPGDYGDNMQLLSTAESDGSPVDMMAHETYCACVGNATIGEFDRADQAGALLRAVSLAARPLAVYDEDRDDEIDFPSMSDD